MSLTALGPEQIKSRLYPSSKVIRPLANPSLFTDAHVRQYREQGFLAIENVFTPDEVAAGKAGLTHLIKGGNPDFKGVQFESGYKADQFTNDEEREAHVRKCMTFVEYESRLHGLCYQPRLLEIVRKLVASDITMIQDMALLKPAHVGREKPWHQDTAYFLYEPLDLIVGTWTALDEATVENGCMHVIPGSHLEGPRPHYHDRDCQMADEDIQVERAVAVPLKPGGTLFFSGLMHHGTPPNRSPARRRALQFHYASVNCKKFEKEHHKDLFKDRVGYAGCAGWLYQEKPRGIETKPE